ncbi:uncharacterized protein LOC133795358 [Humulus lupulus]|uniref:uncharacterized protein LOC133795358 n=1 Tax=Humulus lupulus TaxID=3486 RepID=UPI002B404DA8|nr:uncharacterized protein LOC133795358 [Humulus lupulus]
MAFLMKWGWKALVDNHSLWSSIVNAKYIHGKELMDLEPKPIDSYVWNAILNQIALLNRGMCRKIRNGRNTSLWFHPWVPNDVFQPTPLLDATLGVSRVVEFMDEFKWNERKRRDWFQASNARRILDITLPQSDGEDGWFWPIEKYGLFYSLLNLLIGWSQTMTENGEVKHSYKWIWGSKIHSRLKLLWWQVLSDGLLTRVKLNKLTKMGDVSCPLCGVAEETTGHLFWECPVSESIWFGCHWGIRPTTICFTDWIRWFRCVYLYTTEVCPSNPATVEALALCEGAKIAVAKQRKNVVFQSDCKEITDVLQRRELGNQPITSLSSKNLLNGKFSIYRGLVIMLRIF